MEKTSQVVNLVGLSSCIIFYERWSGRRGRGFRRCVERAGFLPLFGASLPLAFVDALAQFAQGG